MAGGIAALGIGLALAVAAIDFNRFKPDIAAAARNAMGRELVLAGDIDLRMELPPVLAVEDVSLENAEWGSRPALATIQRLEIEVMILPLLLKREIEIGRLVLIGPDILVETDSNGTSNLNLGQAAEKPAPPAKTLPEKSPVPLSPIIFHEVDIQNGRVTYHDGRTGTSRSMTVATFSSVSAPGEDRTSLILKGSYDQCPFELTGTAGRLDSLLDPGVEWPADLVLRAEGWRLAAQGSIRDVLHPSGANLSIHIEGEAGALPRLGTRMEIEGLPDLGRVRVDADLEIPDTAMFNITALSATFGENDIGGSGTLTLSGKHPRLTAKLSSRKLDIRPFTSINTPSPPRPGNASGRDRVFSPAPLPLDGLRRFDADIRLQLAHVLTGKAAFTDLAANIRLDAGRLRMTPIQATAGGTTLSAALEIDASGNIPRFTKKFQVRRLDLGKMFETLDKKDAIAGMGDMNADLTSRGRSVAEVMGNMNGKVVFALQNGLVDRRYLNLLSLDFTAGMLERVFSLLGTPSETKAEIRCLFGNLDIRNGTVVVSPFVMNTPEMTVFGSGDINLKNERLNLSVSTEPTRGANVIKFSMGQLTKIFKLSGTLARPMLGIDPVESSIFMAKAFGGTTLAGATLAVEALLGNKDAKGNPCLRMMTASDDGPSNGDPAKVMKKAVKDTGKSILNIFKKP